MHRHHHTSGKKTPSILEALKQSGHRITTARKIIIEAAEKSVRPFSALDMYTILVKKGTQTNKVTAYRELQFLEKQGYIHGVQFKDGVKRYEIASDAHRHHLICTECKTIENIEMENDLDTFEKKIRKEKQFTVQSHSLEFYGLCAACAA